MNYKWGMFNCKMLNYQRVHDFSYLGKELPPQNWRIRSRQLGLSLGVRTLPEIWWLTWGKSPKSMCFGMFWVKLISALLHFVFSWPNWPEKNEDSLVPFPLACWQDFVFGDEEEQRLQVLKELHVLWNFSDAQGAEDRVESENHWELGNCGCFSDPFCGIRLAFWQYDWGGVQSHHHF